MSEGINPRRPKLVRLGVEQAGKCVIGAFSEVPISLVLSVLQEVVVVVKVSGSEELNPLLEIDECPAHVLANQRLSKEECKEVACCDMPLEGVFTGRIVWGRDEEVNNTRFTAR